MRKHQQQQILSVLKTIEEAQLSGLYADCQEGAIGVGEYIESIEGDGTQTVALLEEYCELLFKASNGEANEKQLRKHLIRVENSVKTELKPNRIEMVFLSYKASMSDSLESIYMAAKDDPDCDAYWIPIPYFDLKPDGTPETMHYEGADCYSDKFEITDWQEYDIEARHPDVVFTFNPYDAGNYVTSVHPDFYCERLRGLTEMLVYVPYFVSPKSDYTVEHLITTAGCIFANNVIVQSDEIRDWYISVFKGEFNKNFGKPEEKFLALGSPKFDKVIKATREDNPLPEEWKTLVNGKQVVFYNTSLTAMLKWNEQYLLKMREVFDVFRKNTDVVLWWRPHPLSQQTYSSMRPHIIKEYTSILENYKRSAWGIYDDTPDLSRAIAWSDAYYGDWSSVIALFGVVGKPALKQSLEVTVRGELANLKYFMIEREADDLENWIKDFCPVEPIVSFSEYSKYKYMNGKSGEAIYSYLTKHLMA